MLEAAELVKARLISFRTDDHFKTLFNDALQHCERYNIDPPSLPRQRRPPQRYSGSGEAHVHETAEDHFRSLFYQAVDTALNQLNIRLDKKAPGLKMYLSMEKILISGEFPIDSDVCWQHDELSTILSESPSLKSQLDMFRSKYAGKTLEEAHKAFRDMVPEVRSMFCGVEQLIRLMLICPVSSCTAERSISAQRRLKNWLRSTMGQQRLNSVSICHINARILDSIDITELAAEFAQRSDIRRGIFGQWTKSSKGVALLCSNSSYVLFICLLCLLFICLL
jgi:hypothetical protein